jgi:ElaB/YqjD/DUF883 family membrane-anchored ribosome-binding protein
MPPKDAEMPDRQALGEDIQEIAKHIAGLKENVENLTGSIARAGSNQVGRAQDKANEAMAAIEEAVRRDPATSLAIALGVGFLFGMLARR